MRKNAILYILLLFSLTNLMEAQSDSDNSFEAYKKRAQEQFDKYKRLKQQEYDSYLKRCNEEYARFVEEQWKTFEAYRGIPAPAPQPVPPTICPEEDRDKPGIDRETPFVEVVPVEPPRPQPRPVEPIQKEEPPVVKPKELRVTFYGTGLTFNLYGDMVLPGLGGNGETDIAAAWKALSQGTFDDLVAQCLRMRTQYRLGDWAYLQLLDKVSLSLFGGKDNEATLLLAWLYCQSGYQMRLAQEGGRLHMLVASDNIIYDHPYFDLDGTKYYAFRSGSPLKMHVCEVAFPNERALTLRQAAAPKLEYLASTGRQLQSERYPGVKALVTVNRNLIDFYSNYPSGSPEASVFGSRWAMYAGTPLSDEVKGSLYPALRSCLAGKSKLQAVEELLNFVQTAFVYEYDSVVWGEDRAFFAEETLFYPYADCEDRAILFSWLVRDLLGLHVVLVYYPGHLAAAVRFEGEVPTGDYLSLDDGRYYIADPTYIGAAIGMTMTQFEDAAVTVIRL